MVKGSNDRKKCNRRNGLRRRGFRRRRRDDNVSGSCVGRDQPHRTRTAKHKRAPYQLSYTVTRAYIEGDENLVNGEKVYTVKVQSQPEAIMVRGLLLITKSPPSVQGG